MRIDNFSISGTLVPEPEPEVDGAFSRPGHGIVFIFILTGKATVRINGKNYVLEPGMLVSIMPFHSYRFLEQSADFKYEFVSFLLDFIADFPLALKPYISETMEKIPCMTLEEEEFRLLCSYHSAMLFQYTRTHHPSRIEMVKANLFIFLAEVGDIYSKQTVHVTATYQEQIVDDFFRLLHIHYRKERKPEFYAKELCLTSKYLSKVLKKVTGYTLYFWICEFVIKEAKIMIKSSNMSITQIADELNFPNSSYFARYFRKYTNMSPLEFKDNLFSKPHN